MKSLDKEFKRFYSKVVFGFGENSCWTWLGTLNLKTGRGRYWFDGAERSAPTVSYFLHCGENLDKLFVCHHCDNPNCVNPNHLFLGTHSDNMKDFYDKGYRDMRGDNAPASKLISADVDLIRKLYKSGEYTQNQLACLYGVHQTTIHCITSKKTFRNVL